MTASDVSRSVTTELANLSEFLKRRALRYTPYEAVANRIVRRVIWVAMTSPALLEGSNSFHRLTLLLHVEALDELQVSRPL